MTIQPSPPGKASGSGFPHKAYYDYIPHKAYYEYIPHKVHKYWPLTVLPYGMIIRREMQYHIPPFQLPPR